MKYDFDGLFVLDIANNHQGDPERAKKIIDEFADVVKEFGVRAAIKFQFRDLSVLVHDAYKDEEPYPKRFFDTALAQMEYLELAERVRSHGLLTIATPFDENSLEWLNEFEIDIVKIASCSATDWPLIARAVMLKKPIIASTAGLQWKQIDALVNTLRNAAAGRFGINHCVALYPTHGADLQLNQIKQLIERYPGVPVGFSTHEHPDDFQIVSMAYALGARFFECHVDLDDEHKNAYSRTPHQLERWLANHRWALRVCGAEHRPPPTPEEQASLDQFKRGAYEVNGETRYMIPRKKGIPTVDQYYNKWVKRSITSTVERIMLQVKGMLHHAKVALGEEDRIEISHHYGITRFREYGAVIISCINRVYARKLLIQLPRQKHPYHYHKKKEETFVLLWGDMDIEINGKRTSMKPGDQLTVLPGQWHKFSTLHGAIVEEVSTTERGDSVYEDDDINDMDRDERKTKI